MSKQNTKVVSPPTKQVDWEGCYVRNKRPIRNGLFDFPVGTVFKIGSVTINKNLKAFPCECCGIAAFITVKRPKAKFCQEFDFVELINY